MSNKFVGIKHASFPFADVTSNTLTSSLPVTKPIWKIWKIKGRYSINWAKSLYQFFYLHVCHELTKDPFWLHLLYNQLEHTNKIKSVGKLWSSFDSQDKNWWCKFVPDEFFPNAVLQNTFSQVHFLHKKLGVRLGISQNF